MPIAFSLPQPIGPHSLLAPRICPWGWHQSAGKYDEQIAKTELALALHTISKLNLMSDDAAHEGPSRVRRPGHSGECRNQDGLESLVTSGDRGQGRAARIPSGDLLLLHERK